MKICVVVPHYDHLEQFTRFYPRLVATELPLVVVDDASPADTVRGLKAMLDESPHDTMLVCHERNRGKGGAVMTGLRTASEAGYTHALQIDADGQHDAGEIAGFLDAARQRPDTLICGQPVFDQSISTLRYYARYITWSFSCLETLSTEIRDALCGFRLYPLDRVIPIIDRATLGERMAFDPELLVRATWAGIPLHYIPVRVAYPDDGRSHFHYFRDNLEISWMHTRLLAGMLLRLPLLIGRKLAGGVDGQ